MYIDLHKILSSETETEILEFKEAKNAFPKDKLGQYFSALGNEANLKGKSYAYIIFGVNDKTHEIVGSEISDKQLNEFKKEISDHTSPKLSFIDVQRIKKKQGNVIVFVIPPAPQGIPISWKGHRYGRDGESLGGLNDYELQQIMSQKSDWSAEIIEEASIKDLDSDAINFAREQFKLKNPKLAKDVKSWDNIKFLDKAKITVKGKILST